MGQIDDWEARHHNAEDGVPIGRRYGEPPVPIDMNSLDYLSARREVESVIAIDDTQEGTVLAVVSAIGNRFAIGGVVNSTARR